MDKEELEELLKKDISRLKGESEEEYEERMEQKALACNELLPQFDPRIKGFGAWEGLKNISEETARLINATCTYFNASVGEAPEYKDPSDTLSDEKWP